MLGQEDEPMTNVTTAYPRLEMLSQEQCQAIHRASLEILRRAQREES